jgi:hypothetical protein
VATGEGSPLDDDALVPGAVEVATVGCAGLGSTGAVETGGVIATGTVTGGVASGVGATAGVLIGSEGGEEMATRGAEPGEWLMR